jgi:hypothetical protein
MDDPPIPDPGEDRIVRATKRLGASMARVSETQELVTIAKERLAVARLALAEARSQEEADPPVDGDAQSPDTVG